MDRAKHTGIERPQFSQLTTEQRENAYKSSKESRNPEKHEATVVVDWGCQIARFHVMMAELYPPGDES